MNEDVFCILNDWFCPVEHLGLPADLHEDFVPNFIHLAAISNPVFFVICGKYLTYLTT